MIALEDFVRSWFFPCQVNSGLAGWRSRTVAVEQLLGEHRQVRLVGGPGDVEHQIEDRPRPLRPGQLARRHSERFGQCGDGAVVPGDQDYLPTVNGRVLQNLRRETLDSGTVIPILLINGELRVI